MSLIFKLLLKVFVLVPRGGLLLGRRRRRDGLARGLDFARVDLFDAGASFFLGEVTVYPKRGEHAFEPSAVDGELGRAWCRQGNATR